jgi:hypothetical protein
MMTYEDGCKRLNDCKYLYLESFGRGDRDLDLRVELVEAKPQPTIDTVPLGSKILEDILGPGSPILPDSSCARFTLVFENYLGTSIINESYGDGDGEHSTEWLADKTHKRLATYDRSHFWDYVSAVTFATNDFPGPQRHFEINCMNHILNVVCRDEPTITISTSDGNASPMAR